MIDPTVLRPMIYGLIMWAVTIYAFRRGGWAEKLAASGIVVNSYLSVLLLGPVTTAFHQMEASVALVDLGMLALLVVIGLRSNKFWPLWLVAFQGMTMLAHFAPYVHVTPWVYFRATALWSWPMLIGLAIGVRRHSLARSRRSA